MPSSNKLLLSTYNMPRTLPGWGDKTENKTEISALSELTFQWRLVSEDKEIGGMMHIIEKNNAEKVLGSGWQRVGDVSFYREPSGDGILRKEGNFGVLYFLSRLRKSKINDILNIIALVMMILLWVIPVKLWELGWGSKTKGHVRIVQKFEYLPTLPKLMWRLKEIQALLHGLKICNNQIVELIGRKF